MGKYLLWIVLGAIAVIVCILAFNFVKKEARPMAMSPAPLEKMETGRLGSEDEVIITLDDGLYHRPGCPQIRGTTQKTIFRVVVEQNVRPCPDCLGTE